MIEQKPLLGITDEKVDELEEKIVTYRDSDGEVDFSTFTKEVNWDMYGVQPNLVELLGRCGQRYNIGDWLIFGFGAATAFELIPNHLKETILTHGSLNALDQSLLEVSSHNQDYPDVRWFLPELENDSPGARNWLGDVTLDLNSYRKKLDFSLGSLIVFMAFMKREESKKLEELWYITQPEGVPDN